MLDVSHWGTNPFILISGVILTESNLKFIQTIIRDSVFRELPLKDQGNFSSLISFLEDTILNTEHQF